MNKPQDQKIKNQPTNVARAPEPKKMEEESKTEKVEEKAENKIEDKKEEKKEAKIEKPKKSEAIVNGKDLGISKKHSMAICDFIRGRKIEEVIPRLEQVTKLKRAIKMKGEIPHRHGNMMSGRYPVNACKVFIKLLKNLNANSQVNGIENPVIVKAVANDASRPFRRGGSMRFKRTNVLLVAKSKQENKSERKKEIKPEDKKK